MKKKAMALVLALGLVTVGIVSGTMAWLTAKDDPVVNVFTPSNINIALAETTGEKYKMVPGDTFAKDPKVKVETGSEACWLFVAITESSNLDEFITYDVADGWTQMDSYENIYYRNVATTDIGNDFYILKGQGDGELKNGCVTVNTSVTKSDMDGIKEEAAQPKLTFNACAVQSAHLDTVDEAWKQAAPEFKALAVATATT